MTAITITTDRADLINNSADFREALAAGAEIQLRRRGQFYGRTVYEDDLRRAAANSNDGLIYFEQTTARELLNNELGLSPETLRNSDESDIAWHIALAEAYGWDTPLYRADYMRLDDNGLAIYDPTPIDELDAVIAYANHDAEELIALYRVPANEEETAWIVQLAEGHEE